MPYQTGEHWIGLWGRGGGGGGGCGSSICKMHVRLHAEQSIWAYCMLSGYQQGVYANYFKGMAWRPTDRSIWKMSLLRMSFQCKLQMYYSLSINTCNQHNCYPIFKRTVPIWNHKSLSWNSLCGNSIYQIEMMLVTTRLNVLIHLLTNDAHELFKKHKPLLYLFIRWHPFNRKWYNSYPKISNPKSKMILIKTTKRFVRTYRERRMSKRKQKCWNDSDTTIDAEFFNKSESSWYWLAAKLKR